MLGYLVRRISLVCLVLFGVFTIVFFLQHLSGDPTDLLLPIDASPEARRELRHEMGLDQPLSVQYLRFLTNAVQGNLGDSYKFKQPAISLVLERLPNTVLLAGSSFLLTLVLSIPLGIIAAVFRNSWIDAATTGASLVGQAIPVYWLGLLLILLFSVQFRWFPSMGGGSLSALVLPAVTLAAYSMARITRLTRSAVLDVLRQDYVTVARSKGLAERVVLLKHVLRNASIPIASMVGLQLGGLLGGAVLAEMVFSWPGIGRLAVQAVYSRDFPVVQAVALVVATLFSGINLMLDVLYAVLNPQIRLD
jgi:peptide/nickel transport system permease protein